MLFSESALHLHLGVRYRARCRHLVCREAKVCLVRAVDADDYVVRLRQLDDFPDERLSLLARHDCALGNGRSCGLDEALRLPRRTTRAAHAFLPVLMTLMLRKRLGTHP